MLSATSNVPEASPSFSSRRVRTRAILLTVLAALAGAAGYWTADARASPEPILTTRETAPVRRSPRTGPPPPSSPGLAGEEPAEATCPGNSPGPAWSCENGTWQVGVSPLSSGAGSGGGAGGGGCRTGQPGPSFTCQNGSWALAVSSDRSGDSQPAGASGAPTASTGGAQPPAAAPAPPLPPPAATQPPEIALTESDVEVPVVPLAETTPEP